MLSISCYSTPIYDTVVIDRELVREYLAISNINRAVIKEKRSIGNKSTPAMTQMSETVTRFIRSFRRGLKIAANPAAIKYKCTIKRKDHEYIGIGYTRKEALENARSQLRSTRKESRKLYTESRHFWIGGNNGHIYYGLVGNVHAESGSIIRLLNEKKSQIIFKDKRPKDTTKYLSYELEFFTPEQFKRGDIATKLMAAGVADYVTLKGDGSVRGRKDTDQTHELVVCAPRHMIESVTTKVTEVLNECQADVNDSCGFHVHLDMRGKSKDEIDRIFSNLVSAQQTLFRMLPPSRKNGRSSGGTHYCAPNRVKQLDKNLGSRYKAINACALRKYTTLEVRLHSGTVNYEKIMRFIEILECIADTPDTIVRSATTVSGFAKQYNLPAHLIRYVDSRVAKFSAAHGDSNSQQSTTELEQ